MAQRFNAGVPERKGAKSREGRKNVKGAGPPTHCPPLHWHIQPYCHRQPARRPCPNRRNRCLRCARVASQHGYCDRTRSCADDRHLVGAPGCSPGWASPERDRPTMEHDAVPRMPCARCRLGFRGGAEGENRTRTLSPEPDFESGASTSSATSARGRGVYARTWWQFQADRIQWV